MQAGQKLQIDVLEVHVVDELARLAQERQRIAAAEGGVAGVEAQAEQARVHLRQQRLDLARCLDVGAGVRVERGHEAVLTAQISTAVVAATGNIYYGLWYPIGVAVMTVIIGLLFLRDTRNVDIVSSSGVAIQQE